MLKLSIIIVNIKRCDKANAAICNTKCIKVVVNPPCNKDFMENKNADITEKINRGYQPQLSKSLYLFCPPSYK